MNIFRELKKLDDQWQAVRGLPLNRKSKLTDISVLRTRVWLENIFREFNINSKTFSKEFYGGEESTGTVIRWLKGKHAVRKSSVDKIEQLYPGSRNIYDLPIFDLLKIDLSKKKLNEIASSLSTENKFLPWRFPTCCVDEREYPNILVRDDLDGLYQWGGYNGFLAILVLLREAEHKKDVYMHEECMKYAYRAFPSFCRDKRFIKRWEEFRDALISLNMVLYTTLRLVAPDKDVIKEQMFSKKHITVRSQLPRSSRDFRYIEPKRPYKEAGFNHEPEW
ncbi:hypothetical protein [Bermanella sp. R86510]|uniref:hypothetical protein n=1 Tax=unclassified Bermanella TaxID=2627862 RepID=UPI0037C964D9